MDSCYKYSGMMINGFGGAVEKNLKEAFEASKKYVNSTPTIQGGPTPRGPGLG